MVNQAWSLCAFRCVRSRSSMLATLGHLRPDPHRILHVSLLSCFPTFPLPLILTFYSKVRA